MNKDTRVCIEMYGVARGFPVGDLVEGSDRAPALQNGYIVLNNLLRCIVMLV